MSAAIVEVKPPALAEEKKQSVSGEKTSVNVAAKPVVRDSIPNRTSPIDQIVAREWVRHCLQLNHGCDAWDDSTTTGTASKQFATVPSSSLYAQIKEDKKAVSSMKLKPLALPTVKEDSVKITGTNNTGTGSNKLNHPPWDFRSPALADRNSFDGGALRQGRKRVMNASTDCQSKVADIRFGKETDPASLKSAFLIRTEGERISDDIKNTRASLTKDKTARTWSQPEAARYFEASCNKDTNSDKPSVAYATRKPGDAEEGKEKVRIPVNKDAFLQSSSAVSPHGRWESEKEKKHREDYQKRMKMVPARYSTAKKKAV
ncbi:unnamed protein product [Amoebophrya sp. A25]|nr:unnamed protein product [Amoebophrya sp. A25]|eukprot:GSA25T00021449001.1